MKNLKYTTLNKLTDIAKQMNKQLYETSVSYSFRIYLENGNTKEFHVYYK